MEDSGEDCGTLENATATSEEDNYWDVEELEIMEFEEKSVSQVMKCLEEEIARPCSAAASTAGYGNEIYYRSSLYVSINGNMESCGSAFSDVASTVMASVDTSGFVGGCGGVVSYFYGAPAAGQWPWYGGCAFGAMPNASDKASEMVDGIDEDDDEWLDRVLGGPMIELEDDDALFE